MMEAVLITVCWLATVVAGYLGYRQHLSLRAQENVGWEAEVEALRQRVEKLETRCTHLENARRQDEIARVRPLRRSIRG